LLALFTTWLISNYPTPYLEPLELESEECVCVVLGLELVGEVLDPLLQLHLLLVAALTLHPVDPPLQLLHRKVLQATRWRRG